MKKKKIFLLIIFTFFSIGMTMGVVTASHTFKVGKYQVSLSDAKYDALIKAKEAGEDKGYTIKTNHYKTIKRKEFYKYKKVKKHKYLYKYKLYYKSGWNSDYSYYDSNSYNPKTPKGYKYVGSTYKTGNGWSKAYYKYRSIKKRTYYDKIPIYKTYKYKVRLHVYICTAERVYDGLYLYWYTKQGYLKQYKDFRINLYNY